MTDKDGPSGGRQAVSHGKRRLRSTLWFDNPDNPGMTALYIERYLNFGLTPGELRSGKPIIGIAQTGSDLVALQPPPSRSRQARARRHHRGRRHSLRIPGSSDPGDGQASDRGARPQPRLSRPRRDPDGLFHRRRRADHRLRQDDARLHHGGGDGQHSRHRAFRRTDEQRLASRRAHRLGHDRLASPRRTRRRQDRLRAVHGDRDLLGAVDRPLQHHGHRLDDERARRGARHEPARLRRHPRAASRARPDRLRDRQAHRRDGVGGFEALRHPHPRGASRTPSSSTARSAARPTRRSTSTPSPAISASSSTSTTGRRSAIACRCWSTCSRPASISARNSIAPAACRRSSTS